VKSYDDEPLLMILADLLILVLCLLAFVLTISAGMAAFAAVAVNVYRAIAT
jgi:hypothetical protein